jgi:RNA polymerase sigma-70 factor (ECF subfamily)
MPSEQRSRDEFTEFPREMEPRLRFALAGTLRPGLAREATQEALVYAWQHWDKIKGTDNPGGYLYRLAKRRAWRIRKPQPRVQAVPVEDRLMFEPGLAAALARLSKMQRRVIYLVEGLGMPQREAAEMLGVTRTTVQTHLQRGMTRLRHDMGVKAS